MKALSKLQIKKISSGIKLESTELISSLKDKKIKVMETLNKGMHSFTPSIRNITYKSKFAPKEEVEIEKKINGQLIIEVIDTGIGISKEGISRLFKPYQQANKSIYKKFGGTGLGLWLSSELVKLMGGNIEVESVLGNGSTFKIMLPIIVENNVSLKNINISDTINYIPNLQYPNYL